MKLTKTRLKQLIKEELAKALKEAPVALPQEPDPGEYSDEPPSRDPDEEGRYEQGLKDGAKGIDPPPAWRKDKDYMRGWNKAYKGSEQR
jgi:hypothetical protein